MALTWRYHSDIENRLAELDAANSTATAKTVAAVLATEFPEQADELTASAIQKRRQYLRRQAVPANVIDFAAEVEKRTKGDPYGYTPRTIAVTEVESDGEGSTRRVSVTYAAQASVQRVEAPQISYIERALPMRLRNDGDLLVAVWNDSQFPYEHPAVFRLLLAFLADVKPDLTVAAGDIDDLPTVSRHPRKPRFELPGGLQAELDYSFARKCEIRAALGPVGEPIVGNQYLAGYRRNEVVAIEGNHDQRLETHLNALAPQISYLRRCGDTDDRPVNSIAHLQRYDEIGWRYVAGYPYAHLRLAEDLDVRHGEHARKGSGNSVRQMLDKLPGVSIVQGHTHRQAIIGEAVQSLDGDPRTRYGIENGTISKLDGLGYTTFPDWQPGWMVVTLHADGSWTPELVTVDLARGVATWRGMRWHDAAGGAEKLTKAA